MDPIFACRNEIDRAELGRAMAKDANTLLEVGERIIAAVDEKLQSTV